MLFFSLSGWALALIILAVMAGVTAAGIVLGRFLRKHSETLREPLGVAQGALLGVVALILAFGLTLAVGRYEDRRAAVEFKFRGHYSGFRARPPVSKPTW